MKSLNSITALNSRKHGIDIVVLILAYMDGSQDIKTFLSGKGALDFAAARLRPYYASVVAELRSIEAIA